MKKAILIFIALLSMLGMAACGSMSGSGEQEYTKKNPLVIRVSHPDAESSVHQQSFLAFKDYVEKETGQRVEVEIHANGVLGGDQEVMALVAMNEIQIAECGSSVFCNIDDKFGILDLPYLFTSYEAMDKAVSGGLGELYYGFLEEAGFYGLGFVYDGCKTISNNKQPIKTVEDLKGMKIRITDSELFQLIYGTLGANPTAMSWSDIYTGLQQGVVDGMDVPAVPTYSNGFYEAIKYWSDVNLTYSNCIVYSSKRFMESLPQDIHNVIVEGARKYLHEEDRKNSKQAEQEAIAAMKASGVEVSGVDDLQEFVDACQPVYEKYRELVGDDLMDKVEAYRK